jgi:PKD repeat protein
MYTVTLTVADNGFATDRVTQTIEVFPSEDGGGGAGDLVARIVADRVIGRTPLTVSFDGSTSQGGAGSIIQYQWHFGDGKQGTGSQVFHEYKPGETEEFTVTLYVWNDKGERAADQEKIIVIVPTDESGDDNPTADIEMSTPLLLYVQDDDPETPITIPTRYEVTFDPRGSRADAGHRLDYYVWDFGDGQSEVRRVDDLVTHLYELTPPSRTHIVRLTVYDNYGLEGTTTANLTLSQPVPED